MDKLLYVKRILFVSIVFAVTLHSIYGRETKPAIDSVASPGNTEHFRRPWTATPFSTRLGAFYAVNQTSIGAGTDDNPYSIVDWENELGLNRNTYSVMFNFDFRIKKRSRIDFSYYNIFRNATITLEKEIHFGDHDYPINAETKVFWNTNIFRLSYGFAFISNKNVELGALVGFHVMRFGFGVELIGNTLQLSYKDNLNFTAPLPDFGLWGTYAFGKRWALSGEAGYFVISVDNIKEQLLNGRLSLQYKLSKHWGFDVGYTGVLVKVTLQRPRLKSDFDWSYSGIFANVTYRFGRSSYVE